MFTSPSDGYQDRPRSIWIDKTYIVDTDLTHGWPGEEAGLSSQQLCTSHRNELFKNRTPWSACLYPRRIRDAFGGHIAEGEASCMTERAHSVVIRDAGAVLNHTRPMSETGIP